MNECQVWICSCKTERLWGVRSQGSPRDRTAWLNCQKCERLTMHTFTGKYRPQEFFQFRKFDRELEKKTVMPSKFWKSSKPSPNYGFSNAGRR